MFATWVKASFELRSASDGSHHMIETFGEAIDPGDKGTAKALSAAFKYAAMQLFCIPVSGLDDADRTTPPRLAAPSNAAEPDGSWAAWVADVSTVRCCRWTTAFTRFRGQSRT